MRRSSLTVILLVAFVDLAGFGLIIPLQAAYSKRLGASGFTFGLLLGVYAAAQFVFSPLLGRLSDRIGRRPVLLASVLGSMVAHMLLGAADLARSLLLLFVARALDGLTGANLAAAQAYIADVTTPENRARGMGLLGAALGVGFVVGPCFGGLLLVVGRSVTGGGTSWPAFGAAAISAAAFLLVLFVLPESLDREHPSRRAAQGFSVRRLAQALRSRRLAELFALVFATVFAFVLLEATFVYLLNDRFAYETLGVSLFFAYFGLIMVAVQGGLVGRLARRYGEPRLVCVAPLLLYVGFFGIASILAISQRGVALACLVVSCLAVGIGHGLLGPSLTSLVSRQASGGVQGGTLGLGQGLGSLARAIAPPMAGLMYDVRHELPYWVGAAIYLLCVLAAARIRQSHEAALRHHDAQREHSGVPARSTGAD